MNPQYQGTTGGVALRVRITGYRATPNRYMPPGIVGLLEPIELSVDGDVLQARFYPEGPTGGFGLVTWPLFEAVR